MAKDKKINKQSICKKLFFCGSTEDAEGNSPYNEWIVTR